MKQIHLGAFEINGVNLTSQGLWARPDHHSVRYKDIDYWIELARLLERGCFDFLFLADSYAYPTLHGETPGFVFEQAAEIPKNDPMLLIPALAAATEHLAFAVTTSTTFEAPYSNARRFATLDHLTRGRVAWNVVTTSSPVVGDLFGHDRFVPHDERYAIAEEYLQLSYALLEGGWDDDAVIADKERRIYADPTKVHRIVHHGKYFDVEGYFNSEPSPQRTPVIFQAGASSSGRAFAARNAEAVFLQGADAATLKKQVSDIREKAAEVGRDPQSVKTIVGLSVVVGESKEAAQRKLDDYLSYVHEEAARLYYAQMTGIDFASLDPNADLGSIPTEQGRTQVERYAGKSVREAAADFIRHGMREFILLGTPEEIVDQIQELVEATDIDGFNYTPFVSPGSYEEFVDQVVPELQRRGLLRTAYEPGTFRERLFGAGQRRLPDSHPGAAYRHDSLAVTR